METLMLLQGVLTTWYCTQSAIKAWYGVHPLCRSAAACMDSYQSADLATANLPQFNTRSANVQLLTQFLGFSLIKMGFHRLLTLKISTNRLLESKVV